MNVHGGKPGGTRCQDPDGPTPIAPPRSVWGRLTRARIIWAAGIHKLGHVQLLPLYVSTELEGVSPCHPGNGVCELHRVVGQVIGEECRSNVLVGTRIGGSHF